MAQQIWIGGVSTDPTVASNWKSGTVPVSGDTVLFTDEALGNCAGDMTGGGTVYLHSVIVVTAYWYKYTLGTLTNYLKLSTETCHFNLQEAWSTDDTALFAEPIYLHFEEPSGSDTNQLLIIDEVWYRGSAPDDYQLIRRRPFDIKGYVHTVKVPHHVGHLVSDGVEETQVPSFKWATPDDEDLELTGFEVLDISGYALYDQVNMPGSGDPLSLRESLQIGPWGTNPATVTSIDLKWIHCAKFYIDQLGAVSIDTDADTNKFSTVYLFNSEYIPENPVYSANCITTDAAESQMGPLKGTERGAGNFTIDGTISDSEEITVGTKTFVFSTSTLTTSSEANSSGDITINIAGLTTPAEVAAEIISTLNRVNITDQTTIGGKDGTSNQYWSFQATKDTNPSNDHIVHITSYKGGVAGNATLTTTSSNITPTSMSGGSTSVATTVPHSITIELTKLSLTTSIGAHSFRRAKPVDSTLGNQVIVYSASDIGVLEMFTDPAVSHDINASKLIYRPVHSEESHTIHDGFYDGGVIDMSLVDEGRMIIDNGNDGTPSGGLQWRHNSPPYTADDDWDSNWQVIWPSVGCELFVDSTDLSLNNYLG